MSRAAPRPLSLALQGLTAELAPGSVLARVQLVWEAAAGPAAATAARPIAERGGALTLACSDGVWAQELDLMAPAILERLNALLRAGQITRLRCVSVPPRGVP